MTQLILNIENKESESVLRRLAKLLDGVTIAPNRRKKSEFEKTMEEVARGEINTYDSVDDLIRHLDSL